MAASEEAVKLLAGVDDPRVESLVRSQLAEIYVDRGDTDAGAAQLDKAIALVRVA